jgi:hemolysin activation/secretion protein
MAGWLSCATAGTAATVPTTQVSPQPIGTVSAGAGPLYIQEYRVEGVHLLKEGEIGEAVYPYLGPGRTPEDIEQARVALEKVYKDKGYQTVSVQIPQQALGRIIVFQVTEAKVGRLRVHGSRYLSLRWPRGRCRISMGSRGTSSP